MPTNKTTQWREQWNQLYGDDFDGGLRDKYYDFFISKHLDTLELLEKEVEGMKKEQTVVINFVTVQGVFDDTGYNQALSHVLAIIRQHKNI